MGDQWDLPRENRCSVATVWQRPESKTWHVLHGRQKIRVGKSRRAVQHLADKINVAPAEKRVGIVRKLTQPKKAQSIHAYLAYDQDFSAKNHRPATQKARKLLEAGRPSPDWGGE